MKEIIIGTRGSELALYQARRVASELRSSGYDGEIIEKIIQTSGDKHKDIKLSAFSKGDEPLIDKGVFTKELEESLLRKEIDIAVHSLKDLPSDLDNAFELAAILERAAINDILVTPSNVLSLQDIRKEAVISTGSVRRSRIIKWKRSDIEVIDIRGNVPTRLKKLRTGEFGDATILAKAGLERLGLYNDENGSLELDGHTYGSYELSSEEFIPCAGQGAIAIEALADSPALDITKKINHLQTQQCVAVEREFLKLLGAGCDTPVGINAIITTSENEMIVKAIVFDETNLSSEPKTAKCIVHKDNTQDVAKDLLTKMQIDF